MIQPRSHLPFGPADARFHSGYGDTQALSYFSARQAVDVMKPESGAQLRRKQIALFSYQSSDFRRGAEVFRITLAVISDFKRRLILTVRWEMFQQDVAVVPATAHHKGCVDNNTSQPG